MADIFDEIAGNVSNEAPVTSSVPAFSGDIFDQIANETSSLENQSGYGSAIARGLGGLAGVVDEILPQFYRDKEGGHVTYPHIFGLFNIPKGSVKTSQGFSDAFGKVASDLGYSTKPLGDKDKASFGENLAEQAAAAGPFGVGAMLLNAATSGTGAYLGERAYGGTGRTIGSVGLGLTPQALNKIGIVREVGETLGPTLSQFPLINRLFGDVPVKASVGRLIERNAADLDSVKGALQQTVEPSQFNQFRTTAELVNDPNIARLEDAVQSSIPNAPFKALAEDRAAVRGSNVLGKIDTSQTPYETSKVLEGAIQKSSEGLDEVINAAWDALPKDKPLVANHLNNELIAGIQEATIDGNIPLTGAAKGLLGRFFNQSSKGPMTMDQIQGLRRKVLEVGRNARGDLSEAGQINRSISSLLEEHLRKVVDDNAAAGILSTDDVAKWEAARNATASKKILFGASEKGTRGLEKLGLKGETLDNTTFLREGLNSPDALKSQIVAGIAGGQDIRPVYKQALLTELDSIPQSKWGEVIAKRRNQWEMVFEPDELARIDQNLLDLENEALKNNLLKTGQSATNPRGEIQKSINRAKGLAGLDFAKNTAPALIGGALGAEKGWNESNSVIGGAAKALLYGALGAAGGKLLSGTISRASDKFDETLIAALRNPELAKEAIEAAIPSQLSQALGQAAVQTGKATALRGTSSVFNSLFGESEQNDSTQSGPKNPLIKEMFGTNMDNKQPDVAIVEQEIDKDPYYSALYEAESGRNPKAKNPQSTASGGFQFIDSTAKAIGLDDPFNLEKSFDAVKTLTDEHRARFGDDPAMLYSAHYLGSTVLNKLLKGLPLNDKEESQVEYLRNKALPRFLKIYKKRTSVEI